MANTLIVTFLLCVAATVTATEDLKTVTTLKPSISTSTTKVTTTTTLKPSTSAPSSTATHLTGSPTTNGSTVSPNTGSSQTNAPSTAPVPTTLKPPGPCASNPCPAGSTCEERFNQAFTCLCRPGEVYNGLFCMRVKVFPGLLVWKKEFEPEMADKTSQKFLDTSNIIKDEVREQFKDETEFIGPEVLELRRKETKERSQSSNIEASIQIIYDRTAEITEEVVKKKMGGIPMAESFAAKSLCDSDTCDSLSTKCSSADGSFTCSCGDGFIETNFSDRLCVARCPAGQIYVNNQCKSCDFGYAGPDCKDNRLLIVVIICSILGGLLIAVVIALPLVLKKSKKKSSKKKEEDIGIPYQSHSIAKAPLSYSNGNSNDFPASVKEPTNSLANSGAPRIPRATANSNWDSRTNLEMTPSNSRQNLIPSGRNSRFNDNQDDMYSFSQNRPKNHTYEEFQPKSNPYSQNRASNPYPQSRGQTNPYYN
ncbi:mucin-13b isoform X2 [Gambusia affinis]|uniref:mucin-13b isoform X2 n=1 Tax=Gambusia affinis TaxID=33528 RepID=UPI001CDCA5FB|nr:mucin-13b isoform X2 [Gambusia affinis]